MCCLTANGQAAGGQLSKTASLNSKPFFNWGLLWSGSLDESANQTSTPMSFTINNRGEIRLHFFQNTQFGFMLRGQVLDRHALSLGFDPFQIVNNPEKAITHFTGGLYHKQTGSRLLFGVLDEWGLSARIRNPWIRSPPFAENHKPLMADLKTAVSGTKEDELYLYLSSPFFELNQNVKLRGFLAAQTLADYLTPVLSSGVEFSFSKKTNLLLETFYTGKTLSPLKQSSWFSNPPALPEREFHLTAAALVFSNPLIAASSDFALSDTFGWGKDIYCNFGVTVTPLLPFGSKARPLAISLAVDGSGERFVNRDGAILSEGFRGAAKIEWKGKYNSLIRFSSVLRGNGLGENFNRSTSDFYYRFPAQTSRNKNGFPIRLTRISLSASRNAENPIKINDSFSGTAAFNISFRQIKPIGVSFSGSVKGIASSPESPPFLFPVPINRTSETWDWNSAAAHCDIYWSPSIFQFRARCGVSFYVDKGEKWDFSLSTALRFKNGRLNFKISTLEFPEKWNINVSWRVEKKEKK